MLLGHCGTTFKKIESVVDSLRPGFMTNGGDISLVRYEKGTVVINFVGTYVGYPSKQDDICRLIERHIRISVPEVQFVEFIQHDY